MPRARLPRRPCPRAFHARATRRAHNGLALAPIALVPAPITLAAVNLRYTAQPVPRNPAQTTVLDFSVPDAGLGWHPRRSAPRLAAAHGSDQALHVQTRRPCRRPPITARYDYDMVFPVRAHSFTTSVVPSVARPGAAAISSPQRDPAVTGPGLSRIKSSPPHPNRALRAPTPDSDDFHLNRRHVTQWCMTRPGLTRTASATVTAAPRPLPDTP